ncbi:hypothetical protein QTH90_31385, partial [Variovorax sp. J2P1-59]|uniref:hypothetical protein n=1 Tax=Variovorax flavidus TaxID=3053501 RepID=UPI00257523E2
RLQTPTLIGCIFLTNYAKHLLSCVLLAAISEAFDYDTVLEEHTTQRRRDRKKLLSHVAAGGEVIAMLCTDPLSLASQRPREGSESACGSSSERCT